MGNYVPDRARNTRRVLITNGDLGTDNSHFGNWATGTPQGMAAVRRAVEAHTERTGKPSWAEHYTNAIDSGRGNDKVIYGKRN